MCIRDRSKESSDTAKERLHLVLMQDRANVSADFLELMKQEIIEVIKKYIDVDEEAIDVHLTNKSNDDGTVGAPALYANIPIVTIKNEARKLNVPDKKEEEEKSKEVKENNQTEKEEEKQQPETENDEKVDVKGEDEKETKVEQRIEETENKDKEKGENEEKATSNS